MPLQKGNYIATKRFLREFNQIDNSCFFSVGAPFFRLFQFLITSRLATTKTWKKYVYPMSFFFFCFFLLSISNHNQDTSGACDH